MISSLLRLSQATVWLGLAASPAIGQCTNLWRPGEVVPGTDRDVLAAVAWDPDGAGPAGEQVVFGGAFQWVGAVAARRVVLCDPATNVCTPLGTGFDDGIVQALFVLPSGELIAGGSFTAAGGVPVAGVARWNGTAWAPIGAGVGAAVTDFVLLPNGDLVASTTQGVRRWSGGVWTAIGPAWFPGVATLATLPNGDLIAGGYFDDIGGVFYENLARWTGTAWVPFAGGAESTVDELLVLPNGEVVAGGQFTSIGSVASPYLARWNGSTWASMNCPVAAHVRTLLRRANGDLLVGGFGGTFGGAALWNGASWSAVVPGTSAPGEVRAVAELANGDLLFGGRFFSVGTTAARNLVRATATAWSPIATGAPTLGVVAMSLAPNGDLVASGNFFFPGLGLRQIARRSAGVWSPIGAVLTGNQFVQALPNGDIIAGYGGVLQRWDGSTWNTFGPAPPVSGIGGYNCVALAANGDVLVGGNFAMGGVGGLPASLARWDGSTWSRVGGFIGTVARLDEATDGTIVAVGSFLGASGAHELACFDGVQWSTWDLAAGQQAASAVLVLPDGSVVVSAAPVPFGGANSSHVQRWDGSTWTPLGGVFTGIATRLLRLPDGDLVASGGFTAVNGVPARGLARWDGVAWQPLAAGVDGTIAATLLLPNGDLAVGGNFTQAGGGPSAHFAELTTSCPAGRQSGGAGCAGHGLDAELAWIGATWRATATGLPPAAIAFAVTGAGSAAVPLGLVFGTALPGCTLHVQPDIVGLVLAAGGASTTAFAIPEAPALVGAVFHHQVVPLALDATLAVTATDAVRLVVGAF